MQAASSPVHASWSKTVNTIDNSDEGAHEHQANPRLVFQPHSPVADGDASNGNTPSFNFTPGASSAASGYFTPASSSNSFQAAAASPTGSDVSRLEASDQTVDTEDEDDRLLASLYPGRKLSSSSSGRNRIYGLSQEGSPASPEGSTFALPYGSSRTNSVESFATFHSDLEAAYDSDQSMLDAENVE
ncbi:hypothetical protein BV25DRAFT_1820848 [Artomyces pyxidatus]|uniref:Uncharacterized protein n=1 Tax=Artomyces pyxidatus TaxID=48021 RepID=A0ACB8TB10_9AGAM|nr:hypothetical protein BV25DRAFT_1820848 [Artomyces pyxidatus]